MELLEITQRLNDVTLPVCWGAIVTTIVFLQSPLNSRVSGFESLL
jgi:hypothetical protein